ncbi:hypothetical protein BGZ50_007007 [Haplosporangium sp. Z 11]|nr:hypothetical protein BGZ50_007007 [Haplosporangium sp. Z 11]
MGVRYNAEKKKIGNYYSTPILSFRMKCHLCDNWFEIQTDPKNAVYVVTAGARKKVESFSAADSETLEIDTPEEFERRATDDFAKLEHMSRDALKAKSGATVLTRLQRLNDRQWSDPYTLSQKLRKDFRAEKKSRKKEEDECKRVADRVGFAFGILPESEEDRMRSKNVDFTPGQKAIMEQRLKVIKSEGLFAKSNTRKGTMRGTLTQPLKTSSGSTTSISSTTTNRAARALASVVSTNTRLQTDPFLNGSPQKSASSTLSTIPALTSKPTPAARLPLVSYGDDDDDDDDGNP